MVWFNYDVITQESYRWSFAWSDCLMTLVYKCACMNHWWWRKNVYASYPNQPFITNSPNHYSMSCRDLIAFQVWYMMAVQSKYQKYPSPYYVMVTCSWSQNVSSMILNKQTTDMCIMLFDNNTLALCWQISHAIYCTYCNYICLRFRGYKFKGHRLVELFFHNLYLPWC